MNAASTKTRRTRTVTRATPRRKATARFDRATFVLGPQTPVRISANFLQASAMSDAQAIKVVQGAFVAARPLADVAKDSHELVQWASLSGSAGQRRTMVKAFKAAKGNLMLVHHIFELPKEQAASFIKDYFDAGGDLESVLEWLRIVGARLRQGPRARGKSRATSKGGHARRARSSSRGWGFLGDVVDWVGDAASSFVDTLGDVVDSVIKAGKSLASAISAAANWTVGQITDLVEALVKAGKWVGDILAAAAAKSLDLLGKYVQAALDAGRALSEVVLWAASRVAAQANAVVKKLLSLGRSVLDVLKTVSAAAISAVTTVVKAILAAGKALATIMAALTNQALQLVRVTVQALLAAGQLVKSILIEAAKLISTTARLVVSSLLTLGYTLTQLLVTAAGVVGTTLRTILGAMLALGRSVAQVLAAIATQAAAIVKSVISALLALGQKLADIVIAAVGQTLAIVKTVFTALISLGQKVATMLVALAGRAVSALRMALEALLAMGITLASLVASIVLNVVEAFRRGFFEGLIALGMVPLMILKAAAEVSAAVVLLAFTVVIELFGGHRPLSAAERKEAQKVFGSSINLARVKIAVASIPADIINYINGDRPFTTMYIINFASGATVFMDTLIHELTHVWQGVRTGPLYMVRALEAQIGAGVPSFFHTGHYDDSASYAVTSKSLKVNAGDFSKFNPEQQAVIVEDYWIQKFSRSPNGSLPTVAELEPYAKKVFKPLTGITHKKRAAAKKPAKKFAVAAKRRAPRAVALAR